MYMCIVQSPLNFMNLYSVVVLNNYKHIKEALAENVFSGRLISNTIKDRNLGGDGNRGKQLLGYSSAVIPSTIFVPVYVFFAQILQEFF